MTEVHNALAKSISSHLQETGITWVSSEALFEYASLGQSIKDHVALLCADHGWKTSKFWGGTENDPRHMDDDKIPFFA